MKLKDALRLKKRQQKKENDRKYYQRYYQRRKAHAESEFENASLFSQDQDR
jgi:hypothetical protein